MIKLFRKNKQPVAVKPVGKISAAINEKAKRFADYLNNKAAHTSRRNIKLLLIVFCAYWGSYSLYIGVKAIKSKNIDYQVTPISVPKQINSIPVQDSSTLNALKRIRAFKKYLDSLQLHDIQAYKLLTGGRPGLVDSIALIEKYYPDTH